MISPFFYLEFSDEKGLRVIYARMLKPFERTVFR